MKVKEYRVLEEAVERGIMWGWQHAHKHVDNPSEEAIRESLLHDIMNEICEWFVFQDFYEPSEKPKPEKDADGAAYWCNNCGWYVYSNPHECTPRRMWP